MVAEKIVVTAREFVGQRNINDCKEFNDPMFHTKVLDSGWALQFSAPAIACEIIWKIALSGHSLSTFRQLDRLFSPSPIATHANFRGCRDYKTGNRPEVGSIAVYRRGNSWQGDMGIVTSVNQNETEFDIVHGRVLEGSEERFIQMEEKRGRQMGLPFKSDKLNLIGFIYPPNREIE